MSVRTDIVSGECERGASVRVLRPCVRKGRAEHQGQVVKRLQTICAAPGCANPVPPRAGRAGRPPIYCSPECRPTGRRRPGLVVELERDAEDEESSGVARDWMVRLRRGPESVVVGRGLGALSARAFATELRSFLGVAGGQEGAAID